MQALYPFLLMLVGAAPVATQEPGRASMEQLTEASAAPLHALAPAAPADPDVAQLSADAPRRIAPGPRPEGAPRRVAQATPEQASRSVAITAPPPEAVDLCEAVVAGRAEAVEGIDCSQVLEAAAFARRSPEERLLDYEDALASVRPTGAASAQTIPNAALVAQRLATGDPMGSAAAQAVASGVNRMPPPEAATVISITNPDGTTGTIIVPPGQQ